MYDIKTIEENKDVATLGDLLTGLDQTAMDLIIKSNEDEGTAVDLTKQVKQIEKQMDEKRKEFTAPANAFVKKVNELLMPSVKKAKKIGDALRLKMGNYRRLQEMKMKQETVIKTKTKETHMGSKVTYRKEWQYELVDEGKLPRDFMVADLGKIQRAVRNGIREIPGVKIFEKSVPNVR